MTIELDRRAFIGGMAAAAAGCATPLQALARPAYPDALVVVDGWVCRRGELATGLLQSRTLRTGDGVLVPVRPDAGLF